MATTKFLSTTHFVNLLAKEKVISGQAIKTAKSIHKSQQKETIVDSTLPKAWNKIISETEEILLDLINETTEKLCGYPAPSETIAEFINRHRSQLLLPEETVLEDKKWAKKQSSAGTKKYIRKGYTGKQILSFSFKGKKYKVRHWIEMLGEIAQILRKLHLQDFNKVLTLKGRKNHTLVVIKTNYALHGKLKEPIFMLNLILVLPKLLGFAKICFLCSATIRAI